MNSNNVKIKEHQEILPSVIERGALSAPLTLRDLVVEGSEGNQDSVSSLMSNQISQEFETEMEILKGNMMLLEKMTKKKSFLLREMKYLLKVN